MTSTKDMLAQSLEDCERDTLTLFVGIEEYAIRLSQNFGHLFKPYQEEIYYLPRVFRPVLDFVNYPGKYYQYLYNAAGKLNKKKLKKIEDFNGLGGDVHDEQGRLIILDRDLTHLTRYPSDPHRELQFILQYVKAFFVARNPYYRMGDWQALTMDQYFKHGFLPSKNEPSDDAYIAAMDRKQAVQDILDPLMHEIEQHISKNVWLMTETSPSMYDLIIRQTGDIRAWLWTKEYQTKLD